MTLSKQSVERLLKVAEVLEALPKKQGFSLHWWSNTEKLECGTVACAAGYGGLDPWHNRRGFRLTSILWEGKTRVVPLYRGKEAFEAVSAFYQISDESANYLFDPNSYKRGTRQNVIRRLRKFVKDDGAI